MEDREKMRSDNKALEHQKKKLQQEIEKMADSKMVLERNVRSYDEDKKWQLPEPGALVSARAYREKNALPLVARLKDIVKNLTLKCINLIEKNKQLETKVAKQAGDIEFCKDKIQQQHSKLEQLQDKADDFERMKRYVGEDKIATIVSNARELGRLHKTGCNMAGRMEWADRKAG